MPTAELLLDCRNTHGEGVLWDGRSQRLWWTDIHGKKLWSLDPETGAAATHEMPARVCSFAPRARGGFLLAFAEGFALYDLDTGARRDLAPFEPDLPGTRLNDGRTDRVGRFVAGGMDEAGGGPVSSVCRVDKDLRATPLFTGVACANAICFSGSSVVFTNFSASSMLSFGRPAMIDVFQMKLSPPSLGTTNSTGAPAAAALSVRAPKYGQIQTSSETRS